MVDEGELAALYRVVTDEELHTLDRLAIRAGLIWVCPVNAWNNDKGEPCSDCGMTEEEAIVYAKMSPEDQEAYDEAYEARREGATF